MKTSPPSGPRRAWAVLTAVGIAALTVFAYRGVTSHGFLDWDDATYVSENALVQGRHYAELARAVVSHNFHPLTMWSLAWNAEPPLSPRPFLVGNVTLHALNTLLVFALAWLLSRRRLFVAALVALVFGLHPMHVESVAWVSERKDVLYGCFFLAGLVAYVKHLERPSLRWLGAAFGCFVLSCLSKGMAVSFPLVMVLLDFWMRRPLLERRAVLEKVPFFVTALLFGLIAVDVQRGGDFHGLLHPTGAGGAVSGTVQQVSALQRLTLPAYGYMMYIVKLLVPVELCAMDPFPSPAEAGALPFLLAPVFLLATVALAAWDATRSRILAFGLGWYAVTVAFVLQWLPVGQALMADRYTYLPYVGLAFMWGVGIERLFARDRTLGFVLGSASIAFAVWLVVPATRQVATWQNDGTLWTRAIEVHPRADQAYVWRGGFHLRRGKLPQARADYATAASLGNRSAGLYTGLGSVYGMSGQPDSALAMFDRALAAGSASGRTYYDRAIALAMVGRRPEALAELDRALAVSPGLALTVLATRGTLRAQMGDYRGAAADLDRVIAAGNAAPAALHARAVSRLQLGDSTGARLDLRETVRNDPANANAATLLRMLEARLAPTALPRRQ